MKHPVGPVSDFPSGTTKIVKIGRRTIGIVHAGAKLYAVLDVCPHELSPICQHGAVSGTVLPSLPQNLEYGLENRVLRCPWHGYEFDLETGLALFTNFRGKLRTFPVSVEEGQVVVEIRDAADAQRSGSSRTTKPSSTPTG